MSRRTRKLHRTLCRVADSVVDIVRPSVGAQRRRIRATAASRAQLAQRRLQTQLQIADDWFDFENSRPQFGGRSGPDANAAVIHDLPEARDRIREMAITNPLYVAAREALVCSVVGDRGFQPKCMVDAERLGITPAQAEEWQGAVDQLWAELSPLADVTGRQFGWGPLLQLVYREVLDAGDVFASFPLRVWADGRWMTRINLIVAERVDTPPGKAADPDVHGGVQLDEWGAPVGFWVERAHPGDEKPRARDVQQFEFRRALERLPSGGTRRNVVQLYRQDRAGQARGIPRFACALETLEQVAEYGDVTLRAADQFARYSLWVMTNADPDEYGDSVPPSMLPEGERSQFYETRYAHGVDPQGIHVAHAGDEVKAVGPTQPSQYFDPFLERMLRTIAAVAHVPYSIAFGDARGANYSTMRREWEAFKHVVRAEQAMLFPLAHAYFQHLVYEQWLDGRLLPAARWVDLRRNLDLWTAAQWTFPVLGHVDPTKEVGADIEAIDAGLASPIERIMAQGRDPVAVARERAQWEVIQQRARADAGLDPEPAPASSARPPAEEEVEAEQVEDENEVRDENEAEDENETLDENKPQEAAR